MKKLLLFFAFALPLAAVSAQNAVINHQEERTGATVKQNKAAERDSTTFKGYLYNKKFNVYIQMDFYHNNIIVPYQEIYGELPGYFGDRQDGRKWLFTSATIKNKHTAEIQIINDYGSEDLVATLEKTNDSTYVLRQGKGSTIKIARNRKWVKMPDELEFVKTR